MEPQSELIGQQEAAQDRETHMIISRKEIKHTRNIRSCYFYFFLCHLCAFNNKGLGGKTYSFMINNLQMVKDVLKWS